MLKNFIHDQMGALVTLFFLLLVFQLDWTSVKRLELIAYDQLQGLFSRSVPVDGGPIVIVAIDDKSLEKLGQWPWPRSVSANLIRRIRDMGARAVGLDLILAEPDRGGAGHDDVLAKVLRYANGVLGMGLKPTDGTHASVVRSVAPGMKVIPGLDGPVTVPGVLASSGGVQTLKILKDAAVGGGHLLADSGGDGVVRALDVLAIAENRLVPALSLDLARVALDAGPTTVSLSDVGVQQIILPNGRSFGVNDAGAFFVRFRPYRTITVVSAINVLDGVVPEQTFTNKIVLYGATASGLEDEIFTPLGEMVPGVVFHAMAVEQILNGDTLYRPDDMHAVETVFLVVLGLVLIVGCTALSPTGGAVLLATMQFSLFALSAYLFTEPGLVLFTAYIGVALATLFVLILIVKAERLIPDD